MPRYYFHVLDGRAFLDLDGTELPDSDTAVLEALRTAGEIIRDGSFAGENWSLRVVDEQGNVVRTMHFSANHRTDH